MWTSIDVVAVIFAIFYISSSTAVPTDDEVAIDKYKMKQTFNRLLNELVDVNQQRLKTINKVLQMEDIPLGLRNSGEAEKTRDEDPLIVYLVNQKDKNHKDKYNREKHINSSIIAYLRSKGVKNLSDASEEGIAISEAEGINGSNGDKAAERYGVLRGWKTCRKAASKTCRKACLSASKNVCKDYKCSSRMKKAFKKECKNSCDGKFND